MAVGKYTSCSVTDSATFPVTGYVKASGSAFVAASFGSCTAITLVVTGFATCSADYTIDIVVRVNIGTDRTGSILPTS